MTARTQSVGCRMASWVRVATVAALLAAPLGFARAGGQDVAGEDADASASGAASKDGEDAEALPDVIDAESLEAPDDALPDPPQAASPPVLGDSPCAAAELAAIQRLVPRIVEAVVGLDFDAYFRLLQQLVGSLGPRCQAAVAAASAAYGGTYGGGGSPGTMCSGGHCCDSTGCY